MCEPSDLSVLDDHTWLDKSLKSFDTLQVLRPAAQLRINLIATPPLSSSSHGPDLAAFVAGHGCGHEMPWVQLLDPRLRTGGGHGGCQLRGCE